MHCHHKIIWKWPKTAPGLSKNIQLNSPTWHSLRDLICFLWMESAPVGESKVTAGGHCLILITMTPCQLPGLPSWTKSYCCVFSLSFECLMCHNTGKLPGIVGLRNALTCTSPPTKRVLVFSSFCFWISKTSIVFQISPKMEQKTKFGAQGITTESQFPS